MISRLNSPSLILFLVALEISPLKQRLWACINFLDLLTSFINCPYSCSSLVLIFLPWYFPFIVYVTLPLYCLYFPTNSSPSLLPSIAFYISSSLSLSPLLYISLPRSLCVSLSLSHTHTHTHHHPPHTRLFMPVPDLSLLSCSLARLANYSRGNYSRHLGLFMSSYSSIWSLPR